MCENETTAASADGTETLVELNTSVATADGSETPGELGPKKQQQQQQQKLRAKLLHVQTSSPKAKMLRVQMVHQVQIVQQWLSFLATQNRGAFSIH